MPSRSVSPGRPPPPSVKNTSGSRHCSARLEHAVDLLVVHVALGAGQHRVVVGDHHAAGGSAPNWSAFTVPMPVIRPSAGVLRIRSSTVRRRRWAAIASEPYSTKRAGIDEIGDVLARRALVGLAPARDRGRPVLVERDRVALDHFGEIGADVVEIDVLLLGHVVGVDLGRLEKQDRLVLHQRHAGCRRDLRHAAAMRRGHQMLHLHGFEHGDLLAGADEVAFADVDGDDRALQRRRHRRPSRPDRDWPTRRSRHSASAPSSAAVAAIRSAPSRHRPLSLAAPTRAATWALDEAGAETVARQNPDAPAAPPGTGCWWRRRRCGTRAGCARPCARRRSSSPPGECTITLASSESKAALVR